VTESKPPRLIDRLWVRLLLVAWVVGIVGYYYQLQLTRLAEMISR
jgi:hypothetical protein